MHSKKVSIFDVINTLLMIILSCSFIYPVLMTLSLSVSDPVKLGFKSIGLLPVGFSLDSYKLLLSDGRIWRYYINTIEYAFLGTAIMLLFTSLMAYPLTIEGFRGKKLITVILLITMFFGGGLIPYYLVIRNLNMIDKIWVMILPGAISAWNVIIFKTFFLELPKSLREAAIIDGAGEANVLFRIVLPLSKPLLATITLFSVVGCWNDYMTALLFLRDQEKYPVQMLLRKLLVQFDYKDIKTLNLLGAYRRVNSRTVKCAAVIVTITPILCIYPYLQKYFAKGVLIGSIKA